MMQQRPIILWTADTKGWAYHTRVMTMSVALPQYRHIVWFSSNVPPSLLKTMMESASIVVCQGVKTIDRAINAGAAPSKIVVRVDSVRVDVNGVYHDVFTKEAPREQG